jgi:uncharacterized membrane protein YeaQ/YmgE (transglycosylase-associated protein family)
VSTRLGNQVANIILGIVGGVIVFLVLIELGPTVTTYFSYINSTSMANVTMGGILVLLAGYGGFFYYFGAVIGALLTFWSVTKVTGMVNG